MEGSNNSTRSMRTWAEISLGALKKNYLAYQSALELPSGRTPEIMCVVKADCYGHGAKTVAPFLQDELGVKSFAVATADEAQSLREYGITGDILILGYTPPSEAERLCRLDVIQTITDMGYAKELSAEMSGKGALRCHIAVDTGMTRIGLHGGDCAMLAAEAYAICTLDGLSAEGMFTHLSVADSPELHDILYTRAQIAKLKEVYERLSDRGIRLKKLHCLNSAGGIYHKKDAAFSSYARLGIILYGLMPDPKLTLPIELSPVMSLKARIAQVKETERGEFIGYGRSYKCGKAMKLATVAIGYADGVPRLLSNCGEVLIGGRRAPIVGRVCMDQLMCDVTGIPCRAGDIATVIGRDGNEQITADEIAGRCKTIGYEIVCGITSRVKRVYLP